MATMFTRHPVTDYDAWRTVFDAHRATRQGAGVVSEAVYQSADDPNEVTLVLDFDAIDQARAFPENAALKAAYREAGSVGAPAVWFADKV